MGDFVTPNDVISALAGSDNSGVGGRIRYNIPSFTTAAGGIYSSWMQANKYQGTPTAPTSAAYCTQTTVGSLGTFTDPGAGGTLRILGWDHYTGSSGNFMIYDRLSHMGGLSGTSVAEQTVNLDIATPAAGGRCLTTGADVEWFLEWYVATGSTAVTATIKYTNQAGTQHQTTTVSIPASTPAYRLIPITALSGTDTSIEVVESVTLSASTLTAGNFGVTAGKRLSTGYTSAAVGINFDFVGTGMSKVGSDACLWIVDVAYTTTSGLWVGYIILGGVA